MNDKLVKKQEKLIDALMDKLLTKINKGYVNDEETRYIDVLNNILGDIWYEARKEANEKS